jgi:hypothetical protein
MTITVEVVPVEAEVAAILADIVPVESPVIAEVGPVMTDLHPIMANIATIFKTALGLCTYGEEEADSQEYCNLFHFCRF